MIAEICIGVSVLFTIIWLIVLRSHDSAHEESINQIYSKMADMERTQNADRDLFKKLLRFLDIDAIEEWGGYGIKMCFLLRSQPEKVQILADYLGVRFDNIPAQPGRVEVVKKEESK